MNNHPPLKDSHWEIPDKCPRCGECVALVFPYYQAPGKNGPRLHHKDAFPGYDYVECREWKCWGAWVPSGDTVESEIVKLLIRAEKRSLIAGLRHRILGWHGWFSTKNRHSVYSGERRGFRMVIA